jgi:hypothetical protein
VSAPLCPTADNMKTTTNKCTAYIIKMCEFSFFQVPGLNLGPKTDYPDWVFSCFFLISLRYMTRQYLKSGHDRFLSYPSQFIIH